MVTSGCYGSHQNDKKIDLKLCLDWAHDPCHQAGSDFLSLCIYQASVSQAIVLSPKLHTDAAASLCYCESSLGKKKGNGTILTAVHTKRLFATDLNMLDKQASKDARLPLPDWPSENAGCLASR